MIRAGTALGAIAAAIVLLPSAASAQSQQRFSTDVSASVGYSNNPFTTNGDDTGAASVDFDVSPRYEIRTERSTVTLFADASIQQYLRRYGHNESYSGGIDYRLRPSERVTTHARLDLASDVLGAFNNYQPFTTNTGAIGAGTGTATDANTAGGTTVSTPVTSVADLTPITDIGLFGLRNRRKTAELSGDVGVVLSARDQLTVGGSAEATRYSGLRSADYEAYSGSLGYSRRVSDRVTVGLQGSVSSYDYRSTSDSRVFSVQATGSVRLSQQWSADGALGVSFVDSDSAGSTSQTSLSGNLNLCRRGERSVTCVQVARQVLPTGLVGSQYTTTAGINWSLQLDERESVSLGANYSKVGGGNTRLLVNGVPLQTASLQTQYGQAMAGYNRRLGERLSLFASTFYRQLFGNNDDRPKDFGGQLGVTYRIGRQGLTDSARGAFDEDIAVPGMLASLPIVLWQRKWLLIVPAVLIVLAAVAAAYLLPRSYVARATLLVDSKDVPDAPSGQSDPIDRRMARIRQQILSRPDLVELIQANDLYGASRHVEPLSVLVDRMRNATNLSAVNADIESAPSGASSGSVAFSLTFDYPQPGPAQIVAQTFVDRLLKLDATQTQADAQSNVNYLQDQQASLQKQVDQIDGRVKQVAGSNGAALSSANAVMMSGGAGIDYAGQIASLQRENAQLASQASTAVDRDPNVVSAEAALTAAQATYSDSHPDVQLARKRLEIARASANGLSNRNVSTAVRQQIAANNAAIADLNRQRAGEQSRIATMAAAQARGPAAAQEMQQLQARADMVRTNLAQVSTSLMNARSVSKLTDEQRGERLSLIEPPVTPDHPTSPNRLMLNAGGIVGGIAAGLALVFLVELIQRPIRSAAQLTQVLGESPLAVVPVLNPRAGRFTGLFRRKAPSVRSRPAKARWGRKKSRS